MNKQEAIREMNKIFPPEGFTALSTLVLYSGDVIDLKSKLVSIINQIEPEKPVIPNFIATKLEATKMIAGKTFLDLASDITLSTKLEYSSWIDNDENARKLALAWFYGYEVEKEKLYTAKLKIITNGGNNYLNKHSDTERFTLSNLYTASGAYQTSFTQSELKKLNVWDNPAFEIEEVE